ncbi:hypothetical protein fugu_010692 [Takifugu bimaculatus]|uniref:Uncharacterized protein n=1 Tax=Takifugu bimaculatus TaxID=433685 RepID=A0A4Z2CAW7_9TELE|nr:hypothetical protein fugu_010692 [Takifugu bimaculatus]
MDGLRNQREQGAGDEPAAPEHPDTSRPEREAHQAGRAAAGSRCCRSGLPDTARAGLDTECIYVSERRKGAKLAGLAEQCIVVSGVGLAVGAHGEKGTSALFSLLIAWVLMVGRDRGSDTGNVSPLGNALRCFNSRTNTRPAGNGLMD